MHPSTSESCLGRYAFIWLALEGRIDVTLIVYDYDYDIPQS